MQRDLEGTYRRTGVLDRVPHIAFFRPVRAEAADGRCVGGAQEQFRPLRTRQRKTKRRRQQED